MLRRELVALDDGEAIDEEISRSKASERRWLSLLRPATRAGGISGKLEADPAAFAGLAFCPDAAAMCFHDAPRDVKAEAQASPVGPTDLPESLENGSQGVLRYARARVADAEAKLLSDALAAKGDFAALRGDLIEFERRLPST